MEGLSNGGFPCPKAVSAIRSRGGERPTATLAPISGAIPRTLEGAPNRASSRPVDSMALRLQHSFSDTPLTERPHAVASRSPVSLVRGSPPAKHLFSSNALARPASRGRESALNNYAKATTGNPSMLSKSLSRLTNVAPSASAVAATHRSFSSRLRPRCWRASLTAA